MSGANLTAEDYIDYIYDDNLDYFTNVDYTLPESWAYLGTSINHVVKILGIFDSPSPLWSLLLNKACIVK